jgi:hypothetical protein
MRVLCASRDIGFASKPARGERRTAHSRIATQTLLFAICIGIQSAPGSEAAAPKAVRAVYGGYMNGMSIGLVSESFEASGGTYRLVSETKPLGLAALLHRQPLRFSSQGEITAEGLRPLHFEARRTPGDPPQVSADFDWPNAQLQLRNGTKVESLPLAPGTQDRLSIMYQFMYVRLDKARTVDFWMTNGRKLDHYRYRVTHDVEIDTALGRLKTTHLTKERDAGDTHTEVWVSPRHRNLAVKVLIVEKDGLRYEQVIQNAEVRE